MSTNLIIPPTVMTIATSDSSGGAGINADIKTIAANRCYGTSVFVALTAQNTQTVDAIYPIDPEFIAKQFYANMRDIKANVIKIGMLYCLPTIRCIARLLCEYPQVPVVLDPVMISQSGCELLELDARQAMMEELFPLTYLITPNLQEAAWLLGETTINEDTMVDAAKRLAERYRVNVLLKGGHLPGEQCADVLYEFETREIHWFKHPRIDTKNCHGTGCTLASAIAAQLALGKSLSAAIDTAVTYLQHALIHSRIFKIGQGAGPVAHMYAIN